MITDLRRSSGQVDAEWASGSVDICPVSPFQDDEF